MAPALAAAGRGLGDSGLGDQVRLLGEWDAVVFPDSQGLYVRCPPHLFGTAGSIVSLLVGKLGREPPRLPQTRPLPLSAESLDGASEAAAGSIFALGDSGQAAAPAAEAGLTFAFCDDELGRAPRAWSLPSSLTSSADGPTIAGDVTGASATASSAGASAAIARSTVGLRASAAWPARSLPSVSASSAGTSAAAASSAVAPLDGELGRRPHARRGLDLFPRRLGLGRCPNASRGLDLRFLRRRARPSASSASASWPVAAGLAVALCVGELG